MRPPAAPARVSALVTWSASSSPVSSTWASSAGGIWAASRLVALGDRAFDGSSTGRPRSTRPTRGPHRHRCGQVDLERGVGSDMRAGIATFQHRRVAGQLALQLAHPLAHQRMPGDGTDGRRDPFGAQVGVGAGARRRPARPGKPRSSRSALRSSATAVSSRYIDPVSTYRTPSASAIRRATVLLPTPAGPSMVTIIPRRPPAARQSRGS